MINNLHNLTEKCKQDVCIINSSFPINFLFMDTKKEKKEIFDRLSDVLAESGISHSIFQKRIKIRSQDWTNWRNRGIPDKWIFSVAEEIGVCTDWLKSGKGQKYKEIENQLPPSHPISNATWGGEFDLWDKDTPLRDDEVALPFFREVELSAGSGSSMIEENHGCKLRFARSTLKRQGVMPDNAYCVTVKGNSMEPVLPDGCTVGIDTSKVQVTNGDWYAIDHHGELRIKIMYKLPGGGYRLRSFNSDEWPDESPVAESDLRVLGRVFWWSGLR